MKISLLILFKFVFATSFTYAQTNIGGTINIYTPVTAIATSTCTNQLAVQSSIGFSVGDRVLIIQVKGATIDQTNTANFGNILSINDAGNYEFGTISAINGTTISLVNNLMNTYTISGKVQLIRVPQYTNATVTSTLTALPWNGTIGGVLVLEVSGNLTLQANINTDADGFRGGNASDNFYIQGFCASTDYFFISNQAHGGFKGEGITELPATMMTGRGALANGGGGGNNLNAGGGGGSNASNGGIGGNEFSGCSNAPNGGIGGKSLLFNSKLFLGGGGGGGHQNNSEGTAGANGGGIIIIKANTLTSNSFSIISNGGNVTVDAGIDAGGGGGGGGTIILDIATYVGNTVVQANGGVGGNVNNGFICGGSGCHCHGSGGGGSGGLIGISNITIPAFFNSIILGGNSGLNINPQSNCFNTSYGAASGQDGLTQTSIVLNESNLVPIGSVIASNDTTICNGTCAQLNATGATSYTWSPNIGLSNSTIANPLACPTLTTTYVVTGTDINNCTSTDTVVITVNPSFQLNQNAFICNGDSAFLGGSFQTASGVYTNSLQTTLGCDSLIVTTLTVGNTYNNSTTVAICQGDSIFIGGAFQSSAGTFTDSLQTTFGCDSVVTTNLVVNPIFSATQNSIICQGDSVLFGGNFYGNSGTFVDSLQTIFGCDSVLTLNLTVNPSFQTTQNGSICQGDSIFLAGSFQNTTGQYTDSFSTTLGCDSLIITNLIVNPTFNDSTATAICQGDSIFLGGAFQFSAGTFTDSLQTTLGCDSVVTTNLVVNSIFSSTQNSIICQGDSILFGSSFYSSPGTFSDSLQSISGCDSILTLILIVNPSYQNIQNISICSSDSIFLAGSFQNTTGQYTDSFSSTLGCDSLIITNLVVNATFNDSIAVAICQGDSIFLGGNFQQNSGIFIDNLQSISGCDSVLTTNLSVNPIPTITASNDTTIEACGSVQINATGGISYLWSPSTDLSCTSCPNPVASPIITTTYIVSGTVNGCSNKDTVMVFVEGSSPLIIPNVFSPNFDRMNDGFNIIGGCITSINKKIYNRWGQLLFESNQIVEEWDGRTRAGENVPEGTYFYIFTINLKEDGNETTKIFKGTVTLLR